MILGFLNAPCFHPTDFGQDLAAVLETLHPTHGFIASSLNDRYTGLLWNTSDITTTKKTSSNKNITVLSDMLGPVYFLRLNDSSLFESRHVFTAFENRLGLRLDDMDNSKLLAAPAARAVEVDSL
jgi:hypothetical protein